MTNGNVIQSVETSIEIVEALYESSPARVSEIAEMTGNSTANVSKHLNTLENHEFVVKNEDGYHLGFRYLDIGGLVRENYERTQIIKPKILELTERTGESASFFVEEHGSAVVMYREVGKRGVSARSRVGKRLPLHQTAAGKAMLAHMDTARIEAIIEENGLEAVTENTITEKETLFEELRRTRERGYAINDEESTQGLYALAAPIQTASDELIGACAVPGPTHRMKSETKQQEISEALLSFTNEIELNISYL